MSNIINLDELRKQFAQAASVEEWRQFAEAQNNLIESYQKQLNELKQKNNQLEKLLISKHPLLTELTSEEKICIEQIDRLEKLSTERQLTLEEVKRFDLLVKNLKLIREESTIVVNNRSSENLKEEDLVAIATQSTES